VDLKDSMSNVEKKQFANPEPSAHRALALWAANCAEHTLHFFEDKYPNDKRPRFALEVLHKWVRGELEMVKCREAAFEAHAAARNAEDKAAVTAARATGQATNRFSKRQIGYNSVR
jgi:cation diffusion facilitator CzcD-associated flavoprotein CzcO